MNGATEPAPLYRYAERAPSAAIAPWVLSLWSFQSDVAPPEGESHSVWPDGCTSIGLVRIASQPRAAMVVCVGPRITAMRPPVIAGQRLWGFRLWPDVVATATGVEAQSLRDFSGPAPGAIARRFVGLDEALPREDDVDVVLRALDAFLVSRLVGLVPPEPRIRAAVRAVVASRGESPMTEVARESGLSLRQLQRRFPAATGLTLRDFSRVRRLREALAQRLIAQPPGWSRVAAEVGFVDHAHLTREFVALTGIQPSVAWRQLTRTAHDDVSP